MLNKIQEALVEKGLADKRDFEPKFYFSDLSALDKLRYLEAAGVGNWSEYEMAREENVHSEQEAYDEWKSNLTAVELSKVTKIEKEILESPK